MTKYLVSAAIIAALCIFFLTGCANIGSPTGGIKDTIPPSILESEPANFSTNVKTNKFRVYFDEYIKFDDINNKLVVSPPLSKKPKVTLRGKSFVVSFEDTLRDNITYTFSFADAIQDNNEGNPYKDFTYVFSTGSIVDTLDFHGSVIRAVDHKAEENVVVALYNNFDDSICIKERPLYITKADKESGFFVFRNIAEGKYKIFAFKELNNNLIYDQAGEAIAFSDEPVEIAAPIVDEENSFLNFNADSSVVDAPEIHQHLTLFMFMEDRDQQYLKDYKREKPNKLSLELNTEYNDVIGITPLNFDSKEWFVKDYSVDKKLFNYWLTDTTIAKLDTLKLKVDYLATDSLYKLSWRTDTLKVVYKKDKNKQEGKFNTQLNISSKLELFDSLDIIASEPISKFDITQISLSVFVDTIETPVPFKVVDDETSLLKKRVLFNRKPGAKYHFTALPNAFQNYSSEINDTLDVNFSVPELDSYGIVKLTYSADLYPQIVQLLKADKDNEKVIREFFIDKDTLLTIPHLTPDKYLIKSIYDANGNKKWDTGEYLKHIQPEQVRYLNKDNVLEEVIVKENWDVELVWDIILK